VNNTSDRFPEFLGSGTETGNPFWHYVQAMNPDTVAQLSRPASPEVLQVMERNIVGLLGGLPPESFNVMITTSREDLGRLLASAMMSGYFLHNAEQRLVFEQSLVSADHPGTDH